MKFDCAADRSLSSAEALLMSQALALNTVFGELARRAALNMGEYMDATDKYMRLALKAQGQCRATLETLAVIKNPPVVFAKQANIAHGPQQVNNGAGLPARTENATIPPNELLEAQPRDVRPEHAQKHGRGNRLVDAGPSATNSVRSPVCRKTNSTNP